MKMSKLFLSCLMAFFLTTAIHADTVLIVYYGVYDTIDDSLKTAPTWSAASIKTSTMTGRAKEFSVVYLQPKSEVIEIANKDAIVGLTDYVLVAYREQGKTIIRVISSGMSKIPILLPANTNPDVTGATVEKGLLVYRMTVDADPTKALELKLQYGNGRVPEPFLIIPGTSSGCSTVQKIEQSGETIYNVTPIHCEKLSLFALNNPLQFDYNVFQTGNDRLIVSQQNTVYNLPMPVVVSPLPIAERLVARASYYQRISGKKYDGDFNGDGRRDQTDLYAKFGQKGGWNIPADVNADGIVNILDKIISARNPSSSSPPPSAPPSPATSGYTTLGAVK